ncbi:glycosyltransferase family 2 protein [Devosia sp. 1566]|uniref:glycosyltransferase family 2 protein n=1 Tax=Devosia sp. 1566 TaxID=2499144 RepID=UPI0013E346E0|nr:glycosyltransferase family 2 protein [Devosia sp. 1566]
MPTVSVVVPTFGRSELVLRAVRSVLAQTMADLELLVVIDGEDGATLAALEPIKEPRLRVFSNPAQLGAARTRDRGAALSTGDWLAFLDDDDEWLPQQARKTTGTCRKSSGSGDDHVPGRHPALQRSAA